MFESVIDVDRADLEAAIARVQSAFEAARDKRLQTRRALELDLRKAIVNGEFEPQYSTRLDKALS